MAYAKHTKVPVERTRGAIERMLEQRGATSFAYARDDRGATIAFEIRGVRIRYTMPMPDEDEYLYTRGGQLRHNEDAKRARTQAERSRWRSLLLVIKAKLEAIDCHVSTVEEEFLSWIITPNGRTVYEQIGAQLDRALAEKNHEAPLLLEAKTE